MLKILILILYNDTKEYTEMKKIQLEFLKKTCNNIKFFFYSFKNIEDKYKFDNNDLFIRGKEEYKFGILKKTLKAFKIINDKFDFDYIIRQNISTVVDYKNLIKVIEEKHPFNYGGLIIQNRFLSGICIILSKKSINILIKSRIVFMDDINIGICLVKRNKIKLTCFYKYFAWNSKVAIKNKYVYRNRDTKCKNRNEDIKNIITISNNILNNKSYDIPNKLKSNCICLIK